MIAVLVTGLGLSKNFYLYLVFMFFGGIPMPFWNASTITLLQETVREDMQGRVFSVQQLIMNTIMPVGMLFFGPIADFVSIEFLLVLSSILMAIPGVWIFFNREPARIVPGFGAVDYEAQTGD